MKINKIMAAALTLTLLTPTISKASEEVIDLEKEKAELISVIDDYNLKDEKVKQEYIKRINEAEGFVKLQMIEREMLNRIPYDEENTSETETPKYELQGETFDSFEAYRNRVLEEVEGIKDPAEKERLTSIAKETDDSMELSRIYTSALNIKFKEYKQPVGDETPSEQSTETPAEDGTIKEDTTKSESEKTVNQSKNSSNLNENSPVQKINSNNKEAGKNSKTGVGSLSTVVGILVASAYAYKSTKKEN